MKCIKCSREISNYPCKYCDYNGRSVLDGSFREGTGHP